MNVAGAPPVLAPDQLPGMAWSLRLDREGTPVDPLVFVDLDAARRDIDAAAVAQACANATAVVVGFSRTVVAASLRPLVQALSCTVAASGASSQGAVPSVVEVKDVDSACSAIAENISRTPRAAITAAGLLRCTSLLPVWDGLVAESMAYSMLLSGAEFTRWRAGRPPSRSSASTVKEPPLLVRRDEACLCLTLNRPARRNAIDRALRDALIDALEVARLDPTVATVHLKGNGPAFCSGGDLDEFGTFGDVTSAHLVRLDRSVAARVQLCQDRIEVNLHGACIGAGIEIPSFAGKVRAQADAWFQLPELSMGLVPGAGGTVGITRRIGRWRAAYMVLTCALIDSQTALAWGLVDAVTA